MHRSWKWAAASLALLLAATPLWAFPVVEWNTVYGGGNGGSFDLYTDLKGFSDAGIEGTMIADYFLGSILLLADRGTIACAHSWFPVIYGSLVDETAWQTASSFLADFSDACNLGSLTLVKDEPLYLGFRLDSGDFPPHKREYGWAELLYDGATVSVISSATERTGLGIYAGTGMAIPEPATAGLLILGASVLAWHLRKREYLRQRADTVLCRCKSAGYRRRRVDRQHGNLCPPHPS